MVAVASAMYGIKLAESNRTSDNMVMVVVVVVWSYCNDGGGEEEAAMGCWLIAVRSCLAFLAERAPFRVTLLAVPSFESATVT